jgi:hypothetical protein
MGQVANVALTDTFDTWRVRSNQSFTNLFEINPTANTVSANTVTGATLVATSTVTVPAASISAVDVAFLANTNTFIGTKLDSSSYTTADVQTKAALANTNTFIGTKLDSSYYTTADVQAKAALANTNSAISGKQDADADTAKTDVVQTFSVAQRGAVTDHGSLIANTAFRQDFSLSNHFKMTLAGNISQLITQQTKLLVSLVQWKSLTVVLTQYRLVVTLTLLLALLQQLLRVELTFYLIMFHLLTIL